MRRICEIRPDVPIVLSSGFAAESDSVASSEERRVSFLSKPYRREDLARALRDVVDLSPADA